MPTGGQRRGPLFPRNAPQVSESRFLPLHLGMGRGVIMSLIAVEPLSKDTFTFPKNSFFYLLKYGHTLLIII